MYNACCRAVDSCSAVYVRSAKETSSQAALVYGRAPKTASLVSWDINSLALRGRVMRVQCMTFLILKQFLNASYKVSVMYGPWLLIL